MAFDLQGVEKRAKDERMTTMGPQRPMIINGIRPDGTSTSARIPQNVAPTPAAPAAPTPMMAPAANPGSTPSMMQPAPQGPAAAPMMMRPQAGIGPRMNPLARGAPQGAASGLGGPRPTGRLGRSGLDPMRLAERAARRGNPTPLIQIAMRREEMGLEREKMERSDANRSLERAEDRQDRISMFQMGQQAEQNRYSRDQEQRNIMYDREAEARKRESDLHFQRQVDENKRQEEVRRQERGDPTNIRTVPVPGTNYVIPITGNTPMGTLPTKQNDGLKMTQIPGTQDSLVTQNGNPVGGLPMFTRSSNPQSAPGAMVPKDSGKAPNFTYERDLNNKIIGALHSRQREDGSWEMVRVPIVDANNNGIPDDQEVPAGQTAPGAPAQPAKPAGKSTTGVKFSVRQQ